MANAKHTESATGPWTNLSNAYCGQLDAALKASDPVLRAVSRMQFEWMHLGMQRGRAWASLPAELSRCKSPVDLASLQVRFVQSMGLNYAEASHRMWQALLAVSVPRGMDAGGSPARDIIEVRSDVGETGRNRQAA